MYSKDITAEQFRWSCGRFLTGIAVVTVQGTDGRPYGITVNSFTSVSLDPPLVLICIDRRARFMAHISDGKSFGINILEENQEELSRRFASREADRFAGVEWIESEMGVPLFPFVLASLECQLASRILEGDHFVLFGRVLAAQCHDGSPLGYFKGSYRTLLPAEMNRHDDLGEELDWSLIIE